MKSLIALTVLSLALAACGKEEQRPSPPAVAASAPAVASTSDSRAASVPDRSASGRVADSVASPMARPADSPRAPGASAAAPAASQAVHTVAKGDTLAAIAKVHGVSAADLARWNSLRDPRRLRIGQELRLTAP